METHVLLLALVLITALGALKGLWRYRHIAAGRWMLVLFGWGALYIAALLLEMVVPSIDAKDLLMYVQAIALTWAPLSMLAMAVRMGGTPLRRLYLLWSIPILSTLIVLTNPWHRWMWIDRQIVAEVNILKGVYGPWFWINALYIFGTFIAGIFYLLRLREFLPKVQQNQVLHFLLGLAFIVLGSFTVVEGVSIVGGLLLNYTGALLINLSVIWWTWYRRDVPYFVAFPVVDRSHLVEALPHGTLVLGPHGHVVDVNSSMAALLEHRRDALVGRPFDEVLAGWPELLTFCQEVLTSPAVRIQDIPRDDRVYEVRSVPIGMPGEQRLGHVLTVSDVTERENLRQEIARRAGHFKMLYRLSERLVPLLDVETICEEVVKAVATGIGYRYVGILLLDEQTGERVLMASNLRHPKGWRLRPGEGLSELALTEGRLRYTPDVSQEPRYVPGLGHGSEVDVPLFVQGRPRGVLVVEQEEPHAFDTHDLATLSTVGHLVGQALERAYLFRATHQQSERLHLLQHVLTQLNADPRIDTSFPAIVPYLKRLTGAARVSLALLAPDGQSFTMMALDATDDTLPPGTTLPLKATSAAPDVLAGRIHVTRDLAKEADHPGEQALLAAGYRSRVNVPMHMESRVIGALNLVWKEPNACPEDLFPLLQQVADAMAMAYERSRLLEEATRQAEELSIVYDISLTLSTVRSLRELLHRLVQNLEHLCSPDAIGVFRYTPEEDTLEVLLAVEDGQPLSQLIGRTLPTTEAGLTGWVARTRQCLRVGDITRDPTPVPPRRVSDPPTRAWMGIPLVLGERLVGVMTVQAHTANVFSLHHQRLLETLAPSIALALENARLYEAEQAARQRTERLFQAAQALSATLDLQEVFRRILSELRKVVPYDSASVQELQGNRLVIIGGHGFPNLERIVGLSFAIDDPSSPNGEVVRTRKPRIITNAQEQFAKFREEPHAPAGIRSWLGVPMLYGDRIIGMITLDKRDPDFYTPEHARVAQAFAQQAAIAIVNAKLFETTRQQAARLEHILNTMPEGVLLLDTDRRIVMANPRALEWLDVLGVKPEEPVHALGNIPLETFLAAETRDVWRTVQVDAQPPRYFEITCQPLGTDDVPAGWLFLLRDVTREREIEMRARQHEHLAALGRLAAGIAHDFNNILQGITGFTRILARREDLPPEVRERLTQMLTSGERGVRLVRQMLDFSRASTSRPQKSDLRDIVQDTMDWLRDALPHTIEVTVRLSAHPCPVFVDPVQMEQVLTNLVVNARDALADTGGRLTVEVDSITFTTRDELPSPDLAPGAWAFLRVSDTGTGIPPDVLPHIFEPFFTTKDVDHGVGLGLAQVYGIVRQHNGIVTVDTTVGRGTSFTVYLPLLVEEGQEHTLALSVQPVLFIWSQQPDVAHLLQEWARALTWLPLRVSTFAELVQWMGYLTRRQGTLLVDLTSPEVAQEYEQLKETIPRSCPLPRIALVPRTSGQNRQADGSFVHYLFWPSTMDQLWRVLSELVSPSDSEMAYERK